MEKTYRFKVKICNEEGMCYLSILPFFMRNRAKIHGMYPISFSELNVPLSVGQSKSYFGGEDSEYFLDFEKSFDRDKKPYGESYFKRDGQKRVLEELEKEVDPLILRFLDGDKYLLERAKTIAFSTDDGMIFYNSETRCGKPKKQKKFRSFKVLE